MEEEERKREQEEEEMIAAQSLVDALEAEVERFLARCTADDVVILRKRLSTICMPEEMTSRNCVCAASRRRVRVRCSTPPLLTRCAFCSWHATIEPQCGLISLLTGALRD